MNDVHGYVSIPCSEQVQWDQFYVKRVHVMPLSERYKEKENFTAGYYTINVHVYLVHV